MAVVEVEAFYVQGIAMIVAWYGEVGDEDHARVWELRVPPPAPPDPPQVSPS